MKSAAECLVCATKCEQLAANTANDSNRKMLRAAADQWRGLADAARQRERVEARATPVAPTG